MATGNSENNWGWLGLGGSAKSREKRAEELQKDYDEALEGAGDVIVPEPEED